MIQRYDMSCNVYEDVCPCESDHGEWVKWEDVQDHIDLYSLVSLVIHMMGVCRCEAYDQIEEFCERRGIGGFRVLGDNS